MNSNLKSAAKLLAQLHSQLNQVVVGNPSTLRLVLVGILSKGHLLFEDFPGLGKTTLAKAVAQSIALEFRRVQCTPDLMPADITGVHLYDQKTASFQLEPGPVFTNILLVDEINRTSPRTQSALLEAMAEGTVTIDRETRKLPTPFLVLATQNPVEFSGTYPLPEAQLDRFFMRLSLSYPNLENEVNIMRMHQSGNPMRGLSPLFKRETLLKLQELATTIQLEPSVMQYIARLVQATREHAQIRLGTSPRGSIALMKAAQALALIEGVDYVTPKMVQTLVYPVLAHRLLLRNNKTQINKVVEEIITATPVPAMPNASVDAETASTSTLQLSLK